MEDTIPKPSAGAMVLALLMLLFGSLMFPFGYVGLSEWRVGTGRADCMRRNVDADCAYGIRICAVAVGIAGP